jgi:small subunit ribosomal protein S4
VNIPSFLTQKEHKVQLAPKSQKIKEIKESIETTARRGCPQWLSVDPGAFSATVLDLPKREDISADIQEQLIVELYSK